MDIHDLKKLALLGICSGMMLAATSAGSVYADEQESSNGEDVKSEKNSCSGKNGCGGPGGCGGSNGCQGKDNGGEKE